MSATGGGPVDTRLRLVASAPAGTVVDSARGSAWHPRLLRGGRVELPAPFQRPTPARQVGFEEDETCPLPPAS